MNLDEWVSVYTIVNPVTAEIIKNSLVAEGIRCNLEGINQAAEPGLIALSIKVQVPAKDADLARKFIVQHEQHHGVGRQYEQR